MGIYKIRSLLMGFLIQGFFFLSLLLIGCHIWYCKLELAHLKFIAVLIQRFNSSKLCINKWAGGGGIWFVVKYLCLNFFKKFIFIEGIARGEWNRIWVQIAFSVAGSCFSAGWSACANCSAAGNMRSQYITAPTVTVLLFLLWIPPSTGCNKALCASDVSKCLIQVWVLCPALECSKNSPGTVFWKDTNNWLFYVK